MDTMEAFMRATTARAVGAPQMVFDWDEAAARIVETKATHAEAGLRGDWEYTGGPILRDSKPVLDDYTYLSSVWAIPELRLEGGDKVACWRKEEGSGWDSDTKWPFSALQILEAGGYDVTEALAAALEADIAAGLKAQAEGVE